MLGMRDICENMPRPSSQTHLTGVFSPLLSCHRAWGREWEHSSLECPCGPFGKKKDVKLFLSFLSLRPSIHTHVHVCAHTHMHAHTLLSEIPGSARGLEAAYLSQAPSTFSVLFISLPTPLLPKANRILRQSNLKIETFTNTSFQILFLRHILAF